MSSLHLRDDAIECVILEIALDRSNLKWID